METPYPNPNPNPTRTALSEPESESPTKTFLSNHRCCFSLPCFTTTPSSTSSLWPRIRSGESDSKWWSKPISAFKKLREWSEIVAGPKWKTFIRRFNRRHRNSGAGVPGGMFQYDPLSYALNFDDGTINGQFDDGDDDVRQFPDFSSRFAAPVSSKSSMDLGRAGPDSFVSV